MNNLKIIDGRKSNDKKELHLHIKEVLSFPEYYGCNLDALYDCLTEINEPIDILFIYGEVMEENLGEYVVKLFHTFREATEVNSNLKIIYELEDDFIE